MIEHIDTICPMSAADHINAWQSLLKAIPEPQQSLPLVFLFLWLIATYVFIRTIQQNLKGRVWEWKWPPGSISLFVLMISTGTHQRLTYG